MKEIGESFRQARETIGISKEELDLDKPTREVFSSTGSNSSWYELLASYDKKNSEGENDGILTAEELKRVNEIKIDTNSGIKDLNQTYNLVNLEKIFFEEVDLNNINGVQFLPNLNYLSFNRTTVIDYSRNKKGRKFTIFIFRLYVPK